MIWFTSDFYRQFKTSLMTWASKKSAAVMAISLFRTEKDQQIWVLKLRPTLWRPNLPLKDPKQIADLSFYMTALFCSLEQSRNKVAKSILKTNINGYYTYQNWVQHHNSFQWLQQWTSDSVMMFRYTWDRWQVLKSAKNIGKNCYFH